MSKFKVGDRVAPVDTPNIYFGRIASIGHGDAFVKIPPNYESGFLVSLGSLALYQEIPDVSDEEIYNMLKPKMDKADVLKYGHYCSDHTMFNADEVTKAIALAYRSGYLRAKKGRAFNIGGEKE